MKHPPKHMPRMMRQMLAISLPLSVLATPLGLQGCSCPRQELEAAFVVNAKPQSLDECLALCKTKLSQHHNEVGTNDEHWNVTKVHSCEDTQILTPAAPGSPSKLAEGVRCEYRVMLSCSAGRLPSGLKPQEQFAASSALGAYFSRLCFLEKAAVEAFAHLARELQAHNAPANLVDRATQAIQEEREHADMTALLAQMYDAEIPEVNLPPQPVRSMAALAYENAVEGCVHETFAPLTAMWQAHMSTSVEVQAVMKRIAEEEAEHAALSWEIDAWLGTRLTPDQRKVKAAHQRGAIAELAAGLIEEPTQAMREIAGMPTAEEAQRLFSQAKETFWSTA